MHDIDHFSNKCNIICALLQAWLKRRRLERLSVLLQHSMAFNQPIQCRSVIFTRRNFKKPCEEKPSEAFFDSSRIQFSLLLYDKIPNIQQYRESSIARRDLSVRAFQILNFVHFLS